MFNIHINIVKETEVIQLNIFHVVKISNKIKLIIELQCHVSHVINKILINYLLHYQMYYYLKSISIFFTVVKMIAIHIKFKIKNFLNIIAWYINIWICNKLLSKSQEYIFQIYYFFIVEFSNCFFIIWIAHKVYHFFLTFVL